MNKEVKYSRFVGIAIVIICIWIVVLALMSAMTKNENSDNMIYVDEGLDTILDMPKSNIMSNYIDMEKEITTEKGKAMLKVRLPKINIETKVAQTLNDKIYAIYQEAYGEILKSSNIKKLDIDYIYDYLENDTIIEINIITKTSVNNKTEETENKFVYDLKNDKEIIK